MATVDIHGLNNGAPAGFMSDGVPQWFHFYMLCEAFIFYLLSLSKAFIFLDAAFTNTALLTRNGAFCGICFLTTVFCRLLFEDATLAELLSLTGLTGFLPLLFSANHSCFYRGATRQLSSHVIFIFPTLYFIENIYPLLASQIISSSRSIRL